MAKNLVIVESPAKARTINRYLGPGYTVKSSMGHIRDLPVHFGGFIWVLLLGFDTVALGALREPLPESDGSHRNEP